MSFFFPCTGKHVVRRIYSSVLRSGNQEYKEKALWKWEWISLEIGKGMDKGKAMEKNTSAKCQRRDRSVVRRNALAEGSQICQKCFECRRDCHSCKSAKRIVEEVVNGSSGIKERKLWRQETSHPCVKAPCKCLTFTCKTFTQSMKDVILILGVSFLQGVGKASSVPSARRLR